MKGNAATDPDFRTSFTYSTVSSFLINYINFLLTYFYKSCYFYSIRQAGALPL